MSPIEASWIINAGLDSVAGLILTPTGAGGTIVAVPLLIFGLHPSMSEAAPIALLAVGLSAGLGATLDLREGKVRYKAAGLMALCGAVISLFGIWVTHRVPNMSLTLLPAVVLAYVAVRMFRRVRAAPSTEPRPRCTAPPCHLDSTIVRLTRTLPCARTLVTSDAGVDFLPGLLDVGDGFIIVPALRRATSLSMQAITATSLAVVVLMSTSDMVTSAIGGHIDWYIALPFVAGALTGMLAERHSAQHLAGPVLQQGFVMFAGVMALGIIVRTLT